MSLNHKLQTFVDVYDGDANKAAKIAGITQQYGRALMMSLTSKFSQPKAKEVQLAIKQRASTEDLVLVGEIANRSERQRFWSHNMRNEKLDMRHRHEASMLLGKSQADFIDVQADVANMRLQLGAPRKAVGSRTLPGAVIEPVEDSTEDTDDGKDTS